jgi:hypothetical protein
MAELLKLDFGPDYIVSFSSLTTIDPSHPEEWPEVAFEKTFLDYFSQDLAIIDAKDQTHFLDIGWYPDGEPEGAFLLKVVPIRDGEHLWDAPFQHQFKTRSLTELLAEIRRVVSDPQKYLRGDDLGA